MSGILDCDVQWAFMRRTESEVNRNKRVICSEYCSDGGNFRLGYLPEGRAVAAIPQ